MLEKKSWKNQEIWEILCASIYTKTRYSCAASQSRRNPSEDSSCLAYNSNKDEIYAFDTITEKIPIGSSCNSWSAPSNAERPASRACARAKRFARAPSITRLSSPRQVVTKFPAELTVRRVEMYKLSRNVGRPKTNGSNGMQDCKIFAEFAKQSWIQTGAIQRNNRKI